jgi:hypothetical protein
LSSRFKKAHKTHALDQRAGARYPGPASDGAAPAREVSNDEAFLQRFQELCERLPDANERAARLHASVELDAAWQRAERLPLLSARRKLLERALRTLA